MEKEVVAPSWNGSGLVSERFGKRLQQLRDSKGFTQIQLAMSADLDRSFISNMENGVKEPTLSTLNSLAATFNVTLSELLEGV